MKFFHLNGHKAHNKPHIIFYTFKAINPYSLIYFSTAEKKIKLFGQTEANSQTDNMLRFLVSWIHEECPLDFNYNNLGCYTPQQFKRLLGKAVKISI